MTDWENDVEVRELSAKIGDACDGQRHGTVLAALALVIGYTVSKGPDAVFKAG